MRLQLDTTNKLIKVEESVNLGEFFEVLDRLLPGNKWKEFKLETQTLINWSNPIVITDPWYPWRPWYGEPITVSWTGTTSPTDVTTLNQGVYNVEI